MKYYQPEWKIYLWKKLLLDQPDPEAVVCVDDFMYYKATEQRAEIMRDLQRGIDRINIARLGSRSGEFDDGSVDAPTSHKYYSFDARSVLLALIELAEQKPGALKITDIKPGKKMVIDYRQARRSYETMFEKKRIAGLTNPSRFNPQGGGKPDDRKTDPFCGLPRPIYEKIENGESLTLQESSEFVNLSQNDEILDLIRFKVTVNPVRMFLGFGSEMLNAVYSPCS